MTQKLQLGDVNVDLSLGVISTGQNPTDATRVEPKCIAVLAELVSAYPQMISKDDLIKQAWGDVIVSDDALLRVISQLRKALKDNARSPKFIKTIPKRGYQLICAVKTLPDHPAKENIPNHPVEEKRDDSPGELVSHQLRHRVTLLLAILILAAVAFSVWAWIEHRRGSQEETLFTEQLERADNFYHQMRQADNEMAISLYQQSIAMRPDSAEAQSGLANAIVQRLLRWSPEVSNPQQTSMREALEQGLFASDSAKVSLARAQSLALRAVELSPNNPKTHKALGFVLTALGDFAAAKEHYEQALQLDPDAWDVLINLAGIYDIEGQPQTALNSYQRAYEAMSRRYDVDIAKIRPWHSDIGTLIADRLVLIDEPTEAEIWYRKVLANEPLHVGATVGLSSVLRSQGEMTEANSLCRNINERLTVEVNCYP